MPVWTKRFCRIDFFNAQFLQIEAVWKQKIGDTAIAMTKNSPYKKFIDQAILKMVESGKLKKILQRWKIDEPDCSPLTQKGRPLNFNKLISFFFIIGVGVLLAIFVVVFENLQFKLLKKINDPNNTIDHEFLRFKLIITEIHKNAYQNKIPASGVIDLLNDSYDKITKEKY